MRRSIDRTQRTQTELNDLRRTEQAAYNAICEILINLNQLSQAKVMGALIFTVSTQQSIVGLIDMAGNLGIKERL